MSVIRQSNVEITMDIAMNLSAINSYNTLWSERKVSMNPSFLDSLRSSGSFESIGSSNRIEGNTLSDDEIRELLAGLTTRKLASRDEEEVVGYAESLRTIYDCYKDIPLSENYIKQIHKMLLLHATRDERHRGEYKTVDNAVASFDKDGHELGIVFRTASPFDTPFLMRELVAETNDMLADESFSPIITIGIFIVHFLAIHPFQDGNGRMSRLLTNLLLLKSGYSFIEYYSLERLVEEDKSFYYSALRRTQKTFTEERYDYVPWLSYFTSLLKKETERLDEKIEAYNKDHRLNADEKAVLAIIRRLDGVGVSRIAEEIPSLSRPSLRGIINRLISYGLIEKHGERKGTWYSARLS